MAEDKYSYETNTKWIEGKRMKLMVKGQPDLQVSTPPEFGGPEGFLSPEDLFVASASTCFTTTFFAMAERARLNYVGFICRATGILEKLEGKGFQFTKIDIYPEVTVADEEERERVEQVLGTSKKYCLVTNSMKSEVNLHPKITVKKD